MNVMLHDTSCATGKTPFPGQPDDPAGCDEDEIITSRMACSVLAQEKDSMTVASSVLNLGGTLHAFAARVLSYGLNIIAGCIGTFDHRAWGQFQLTGAPDQLARFRDHLEEKKT